MNSLYDMDFSCVTSGDVFFSGIFAYQCFYVKKTPVMWHVKASFLSITCIYSSYSANKTSAIWMTLIHLNIHPYM